MHRMRLNGKRALERREPRRQRGVLAMPRTQGDARVCKEPELANGQAQKTQESAYVQFGAAGHQGSTMVFRRTQA